MRVDTLVKSIIWNNAYPEVKVVSVGSGNRLHINPGKEEVNYGGMSQFKTQCHSKPPP